MDEEKRNSISNEKLMEMMFALVSGTEEMIKTGRSPIFSFSRILVMRPEEVDHLRKIYDKLLEVIRKVTTTNLALTIKLDEICDCPHHIHHLESVGVVTLEDFLRTDPLLLRFALQNARVVGVNPERHLHLFLKLRKQAFPDFLARMRKEDFADPSLVKPIGYR